MQNPLSIVVYSTTPAWIGAWSAKLGADCNFRQTPSAPGRSPQWTCAFRIMEKVKVLANRRLKVDANNAEASRICFRFEKALPPRARSCRHERKDGGRL